MQVNNEIFNMVNLTGVGLLSTAAVQLGMDFTPEQLMESVVKSSKDDMDEMMNSLDMLIKTNLISLKDGRYYINGDYIIL